DKHAGTLQPLADARGLAHAAVKGGVAIHTSSTVIATERNGSRWTVKTSSGEVSAEWIIVATDAYSTGPWEQVRSEQVH
ncbi:FAD-dependent oxidoreductase, partial [Rhizobium ruizarguesonis]